MSGVFQVNIERPELPKTSKDGQRTNQGARLNRDNILEWDLRIKPNETLPVEIRYTVDCPKGEKVEFREY